FVFGFGAGGFSGWSRSKERLDAAVGIPAWTPHDLRRSAASGMGEAGVLPHIIEAALNHVSGPKGGIAGVYNHAKYEKEMREALALWAAHVLKIVKRRKNGRAA